MIFKENVLNQLLTVRSIHVNVYTYNMLVSGRFLLNCKLTQFEIFNVTNLFFNQRKYLNTLLRKRLLRKHYARCTL